MYKNKEEKQMDKNYALRFLTWSYFKIDINDEEITCEDIIKACIEKAYSDATMQGAYNTLSKNYENENLKKEVEKKLKKDAEEKLKKKIEKQLKKETDEKKKKTIEEKLKKDAEEQLNKKIKEELNEKLKEKAAELLKDRIINILVPKTSNQENPNLCNETSSVKADYDEWHYCTCNELYENYKNVKHGENKEAFSYGNAQKWVNMTVKYLYVFYNIYAPENPEHDFSTEWKAVLDNYGKDFHVPIDNYILENIWDKALQNCESGEKRKCDKDRWRCMLGYIVKDEKKIHSENYNSEKVIAWSKWDSTKYKNFQEKIKETIKKPQKEKEENPLDWEADAWIKIAKKRNEIIRQGKIKMN